MMETLALFIVVFIVFAAGMYYYMNGWLGVSDNSIVDDRIRLMRMQGDFDSALAYDSLNE